MSLPNYLAKIKSSGVYRYVFDKSQVPVQDAETLRLVVGYSEKGPFNTPVYVDNKQDFITLFGNINKRLEKKGVFFHRMALQALAAGPILALNIKPFKPTGGQNGDGTSEMVGFAAFNPWDTWSTENPPVGSLDIINAYDTNRFWKLDENLIPEKIKTFAASYADKYINILTTDIKEMSCSYFIRPCAPAEYDITVGDWFANQTDEEIPSYLEGHEDRKLNEFFADVYVFRGKFTYDLCKNGSLSAYFNVIGDDSNYSVELKTDYRNQFEEVVDALEALSNDTNSKFIAKYQGCLLPAFKDGNGNFISMDILFNMDHSYHKMLMKLDESIIDSVIEDCFESDVIKGYTQFYPATHPIYLEGYTYNTIDKNMSLNDILYGQDCGVLGSNGILSKGIYTALTNNVDCEYHYIVDTFASELKTGCKKEFAMIAKDKGNAFAILNAPAMSKFVNNRAFQTNGKFDITKIASKNQTVFSLPLDTDGASYCAFYTPLIFAESVIKTVVPSAALVSNNFMEKWNSRQPYYIVAGPNYGRINANGLVGPDYNYSRADLDVLEPLGINAIIYVPRKGTYINSNQTAKQTPVTALSKVHVRELVIYLQDEIEKMLQNYQWELNTSVLRDTVKTKADSILERVAANGGVYAYLNVCDESNNGPEVIDNEMIILDTSIEPARGAGKMAQRLTIHKTGGISSLVK